jgi:hypothetical protein
MAMEFFAAFLNCCRRAFGGDSEPYEQLFEETARGTARDKDLRYCPGDVIDILQKSTSSRPDLEAQRVLLFAAEEHKPLGAREAERLNEYWAAILHTFLIDMQDLAVDDLPNKDKGHMLEMVPPMAEMAKNVVEIANEVFNFPTENHMDNYGFNQIVVVGFLYCLRAPWVLESLGFHGLGPGESIRCKRTHGQYYPMISKI